MGWHRLLVATKNLSIAKIFYLPTYGGIVSLTPQKIKPLHRYFMCPPMVASSPCRHKKSIHCVDILCAHLWWHSLLVATKNLSIAKIFYVPTYGGILSLSPQKIYPLRRYFMCPPMVAFSPCRHKKSIYCEDILCAHLWWHPLLVATKNLSIA